MNTWFGKIGMGALALTLAGVLGGCNDNGGGGLVRLFFGINGSGNCTSVIVDVNLDDADAVIARDEFGDVQCVLNATLDNNGCSISFTELQDGTLRAVISGCTIPAVTNLFNCLFENVDISELQSTATAQCSCTNQNCDGTPPVCISLDPDPRSCEICDNGEDDDGNGLVDCDDPNCENSPECAPTTTTTSTSTSTVGETTSTTDTTTTSSSTTSTTLEDFPLTCRMVFHLPDDVTVGSLQWDTDYSNAPGFFLGQGGNVECASLVNDALAAFNDVEATEVLDSGIISLAGFTGPIDVSECTFKAAITPVANDFTITVTEASNPDLMPIVPLPDVILQTIQCEGVTPTTTTAGPDTTTTTLDGGNPPKDYTVLFKLDTASAGVGALQWTANYATATGEFQGSGALVSCTNQVGGALFAPNDVDATRKLTLGVIALTPFTAPTNLVSCTFNGFTADPPVPGDFALTIDDATDSDGAPINVELSVTVTPL
ncbi:MAG: hypothetical protein ABR538_16240 [Candidatus Binatia bacterium]